MRKVTCTTTPTSAIRWLGVLLISLLAVPSPMVKAEPTTIDFIYLAGADASEERYRALTEAFERENPDIKVNRMRVIDSYPDRLTTLIATGTVPDVISLDMNFIMAFGDERFLYDLTPFIEKTPEYEIEYVAQPMLDVFTVDGKLFAAPIWANPSAYFYNADMFDQQGLETPGALYARDEWTWDAFEEAAKKLTRKLPDDSFDVVGATLHLPRTWIYANGGREVDSPHRPTESYFSSNESLEALEWVRKLVLEDDAMREMSSRLNFGMRGAIGIDGTAGFIQGQVGMTTRWLATLPRASEGGFDVGFVPYPKGPGSGGRYASDLGMFGVAISRATEHVDAAWRFVSFITGAEGAEVESNYPGATPSRPSQLNWLNEIALNPEVYPDLLTYGTLRVISRDWRDIHAIINEEVRTIWGGQTAVQNAAAEIDRRLSAYLRANPQ